MGDRDPHPIVPAALVRRGDWRAATDLGSREGRDRRTAGVTGALFAGLLAGYGVAIPVGAIGALIVGLTARTSWRVGAAAALGVATADGVFAVAAVLGGAALGRSIAPVSGPLRWIAAVVLVGLAGRTAILAIRRHATVTASGTGLTS